MSYPFISLLTYSTLCANGGIAVKFSLWPLFQGKRRDSFGRKGQKMELMLSHFWVCCWLCSVSDSVHSDLTPSEEVLLLWVYQAHM